MYIIAGLGNPTRKYEKTRHNIGFRVMDAYADRHGMSFDNTDFNALCARGSIEGKKVLLLKPQTYMNLSGESLVRAASFYKAEPSDIILIHDDVEFDTGVIKIRSKGSGGTHNGMKSVVECLAFKDFPRLRIGIGPKGDFELYDYVLAPFTQEQEKLLAAVIPRACDILDMMLLSGVDKAMNEYNPKKQKKPSVSEDDAAEDWSRKDGI